MEVGRESCDNGGVNVCNNSDPAMTCWSVSDLFFFWGGGGGGVLQYLLLQLPLLGRSSLLYTLVLQCVHSRVYGCQATLSATGVYLSKHNN